MGLKLLHSFGPAKPILLLGKVYVCCLHGFLGFFSRQLQGFFQPVRPLYKSFKNSLSVSHYLILGPSNKGTTRKIMVKVENVEFASDLFLTEQFLIT